MKTIQIESLIYSAKLNLEMSRYYRGVGDMAMAAKLLARATARRKKAALMIKGVQ